MQLNRRLQWGKMFPANSGAEVPPVTGSEILNLEVEVNQIGMANEKNTSGKLESFNYLVVDIYTVYMNIYIYIYMFIYTIIYIYYIYNIYIYVYITII